MWWPSLVFPGQDKRNQKILAVKVQAAAFGREPAWPALE